MVSALEPGVNDELDPQVRLIRDPERHHYASLEPDDAPVNHELMMEMVYHEFATGVFFGNATVATAVGVALTHRLELWVSHPLV